MAEPHPGYPPQGQPGYPPQGQPSYPPQGYQQSAAHTVTVQPVPGQVVVTGIPPPPDYCFLSWFACLCCFWPVGICAIINSNDARSAINRGDIASANSYSQSAKKFSLCAIGVGIFIILLSIILRVALVSSYSSHSTTT